MSGTAGMLGALAAFNTKNTGTFYPDLYKLKLQTLNAGKKTPGNFVYTFTVTATTSASAVTNTNQTNEYLKMLVEFRRLFPDVVFYCTKSKSASQPTNLSLFYPYPLTGASAPTNFPALTAGDLFYISVPLANPLASPGVIGTGATWLA